MTTNTKSLLATAFLALALPGVAQAQGTTPNFGYYDTPANVSAFVPFVDGPASADQKAILATSLSALGTTSDLRFTMDTGSTGIAISAEKFNPDPGGHNSEKGYIRYSSSDITEKGYLTTTKVDFKDGRGNVVASAEVKVLVVMYTCDKSGVCQKAKDVSYFGVGFDRGGIQAGTPNHSTSVPNANPFLNLTRINGVSPEDFAKLRPGYVITNSAPGVAELPGVTLGITSAVNADNYAFAKLTPNTSGAPPAGCPSPCQSWHPMLATVTAGNGTTSATANNVPFLPDSGVDHMLLAPPDGSGLTPGPTAPNGTTVQIQLPGQPGATVGGSYDFTVGQDYNPANPLVPAYVQIDKGQPNVNTGITFFTGFDYMYDAVGGFIGYRSNGYVPSTYASSIPILSLIGDVALPTGFTTDYLTNLAGDTSILPTDTATFQSAISGTGRLTVANGTVVLRAANTYSGGTTIASGATLRMGAGSSLLASGAVNVNGTFDLLNSNQTIGALSGSGSILLGTGTLTAGGATNSTFSGVIGGSGGLVKQGAGVLTLTGANTYAGGTVVQTGTLQGTTTSLQGDIVTNAMLAFSQGFDGTFANVISGSGGVTKSGTGFVTLSGNNTYTGGTFVQQGVLQGTTSSLQGNIVNNAIVAFEQNGPGTYAGNMSGTGSVSKRGPGTVTFSGTNSYSGGTILFDGILKGTTNSLQGNIVNGGEVVFEQGFDGTYAGNMSGTGSVTLLGGGLVSFTGVNTFTGGLTVAGGTLQGNTSSLQGNIAIAANSTVLFNQTGYGTFAGVLSGDGGVGLTGGGTVNLAGNNTYIGPTTVSNGLLAVNGSITSNVTVGPGGSLGGNGLIFGNVTNGGTLAPGNSIGTLNIVGNLTQTSGGTYQVELDNQGQADRVNVTGTATLGGTVTFLANPGSYAASQTYTILNAAGGLAGTYAGAMGNYAFLFPSLSYDASNVYLTVTRSFARGAQTPNQAAVGAVFDVNAATATGDFANAIAALTTLSPAAGAAALNALSGQNYSGFSSVGVQGAQLFMSNFAGRIGGASGGGNRVALTEACDVACDAATPALWGAWGGVVGGLGTVGGSANAGTLTYNLGGFAGGLDRKLTPDFLLGVTVGYSGGTQWVQGFQGQGTTSTVQAGLYGSFARGPFYLDGLAAYAYSDNQMTRQIAIPGFGGSTARGQTGVNQVFGQIETGYRLEVGGLAGAYVIPFARLQAATATQNAFTETGAGSLGLSVAAQTTNSLRTVFGAQLGGAMDLGWREKLALQFRLGWGHEFADTARPVTASFIGAPATPFTTYGAAPLRDSVVLGLAANTAIAEATSAYLRYEGDVSYQNANHALTAGVRMTW